MKQQESKDQQLHLQISALEATADGVVITDTDGYIQWVNPAYSNMTGYLRDEVKGKHTRLLKSGKQEPEFYKELWDTIKSGKVWHGELWNKRKDGSIYLEEQSITPVLDDKGNVNHFVAIKRDISESYELKRQLEQAQKMEAIGQLTGGVAHNFNNKLATIMGYTELAREEILSFDAEDIKDYLEEIYTASISARDLVKQMLSFSRADTGEYQLLKLDSVVKESLKIFATTLPSSIQILTKFDGEIPYVNGDPVKIHQILMTLVVNARDAMDGKGNLTIGVQHSQIINEDCNACHNSVTGDFAEIFVQDTGPGINAENIDRVFLPFFTTKELAGGTGMGLSVAHGMVHDQGGHILIESGSVDAAGSKFRLLFPCCEAKSEEEITEESAHEAVVTKAGGAHILLVDDEVALASFLKELFESQGYKTTIETDGAAAIEKYRSGKITFDLVVTDQTMPGLTGIELSNSIHSINPNMPVILMSGYGDRLGDKGDMDIPGISGYLAKPFKGSEILSLISEVLARSVVRDGM